MEDQRSIFSIFPRTLFLVYEIITRPDSSCRKLGGREGKKRKNRETANTRYQTPRPYSKFLAPSIQFRYRHTHHPTKPNIRREKKSKNVRGGGREKRRGGKKKKKNEDPSTVNRAISNFQRSQHTARHLFIFERPRPNQFPFFDSLDRKLPVSLSLPLFFSSSKKKKTRVPATQKYVARTVNSSNVRFVPEIIQNFSFRNFNNVHLRNLTMYTINNSVD